MNKYLIVLAGLPGTGKTTISKKLLENLGNCIIISQNDIRRKHGIRKMPKTQEEVLREIDILIREALDKDNIVIFDSVNRYSFRRHQMYGIASCCRSKVITLECVCSEEEAKKRIRKRSVGDGLISDPNNPEIYDKLARLWEDINIDFKYHGEDHVSYLVYDSEKNQVYKKIINKESRKFINEIKKILTR